MAKSTLSPASKIDSTDETCWLCGGWGCFPIGTPASESRHDCPVCVLGSRSTAFNFSDCDSSFCFVTMKRHPLTGATLCEHSTNPEAVIEFDWSLPRKEMARRYHDWLRAVHAYERGEGGRD